MISAEVRSQIEEALGESLVGAEWTPGVHRVHGRETRKQLILKIYQPEETENVRAEIEGLSLLGRAGKLVTPDVLGISDRAFVMTLLEPPEELWDQFAFGAHLAETHLAEGQAYGASMATFCGPTRLDNSWHSSWESFFLNGRLRSILSALGGQASSILVEGIEEVHALFCSRWRGISHVPRLVHGDLWQGNVISQGSQTGVIDPAYFYGHPEVDLAMLTLFGKPSPEFWEGYASVSPLMEGYLWRFDYYNLFHVLNHFSIFGGHYGALAEEKLSLLKKNF